MRIGILGSGLMGSKLGTILARAGHEVVFSYPHSQKKLERLAKEAGRGARADTPAEAVADAVRDLILDLSTRRVQTEWFGIAPFTDDLPPHRYRVRVGWQVLTESGLPERAA